MLTEAKYEAIVCLLRGGASDEVIMKSQGVNEGTLGRVRKSNGSYEEYKRLHGELVKIASKKRKHREKEPASQVIEHRQTVTLQASHYMETELRVHTEILKGISAKIAHIMEQMDQMLKVWEK